MTRTRLLAALVMGPVAIGSVLFLPTPWLVAMAKVDVSRLGAICSTSPKR